MSRTIHCLIASYLSGRRPYRGHVLSPVRYRDRCQQHLQWNLQRCRGHAVDALFTRSEPNRTSEERMSGGERQRPINGQELIQALLDEWADSTYRPRGAWCKACDSSEGFSLQLHFPLVAMLTFCKTIRKRDHQQF